MSDKDELRKRLKAARAELTAAAWTTRSDAVQAFLIADPVFKAAETVALYAALRGEVRTDALAAAALDLGQRLVYPEILDDRTSMRFVQAERDARWFTSPSGFQVPVSIASVPLDEIDLMVLPGLAFDREGRRLGRGAGHYDRTLTQPHHAKRVGLAFDFQLLDAIPEDPWDVRLDAVVTEAGIIRAPERPGR